MRAPLAILVAVVAVLGWPAAAQPATPSLPDIEDEVMCPICGTLLELSQSPQAERERVYIRALIARGSSKEQIKDALVAEYGQEVLAEPAGTGFDLSAYLVPIAALIVAAGGLAAAVIRWRRRSDDGPGEDSPPPPEGEDASRLDADLARYDL